ncbi:MAG: biotin transporter BioY [Candidatus Gastranaerophilaceae bacterium]
MTEEVKPRIRVIKKEIEGIRLSGGSILLMLCCTFLLIISTFVQVNINHFIIPSGLFNGEHLVMSDFIHTYKLIPQIPVVMFIGAFLGRKYGITSLLIYLLLGLFIIPVFALGGGPKYIFEYSFGYILAYIPAVFFAGSILKSGFTNRNIIQAVIVGVLTIHLIGTLYMLFIASIRHEGWAFMSGWITAQSGIKIIYDFVFSLIAVFIAKYAKIVLWFYM